MDDASESPNRELSRCFQGVVRVPLDDLNFEHSLFREQHRPVSQQIVNHLRQAFEKEGIRRDEPKNWIDALVDPHHLTSVLAENGLPGLGSEGEGIPVLQLGLLNCLQGIHRILAASDLLRRNDRWWTVRLYSKGNLRPIDAGAEADADKELPMDVCVGIIEDSLNEQQHSDGEIFRKIRTYCRQGDKRAERKWWARLSTSKRKDLRQLLRSSDLSNAFDRLVDMPGMWRSFQLGTLHRLLTLHCDEELLRYLTRISEVWGRVLQAANAPPETVDRATVEKLELLAPSVSRRDHSRIESLINSGEIFSGVTDARMRRAILSAFLSTPGLIPSLTSFLENLKYLEPCCHILKKLLPGTERRTIYRSLSASYVRPDEQLVEYPTGRRARTMGDDAGSLWLAYAQLWAFCMRNFPSMTETAPRKVAGRAKPSSSPNHALWHHLGDLAVKLGFRTTRALELQRRSPHESLAEQLLRSLHPGSPPDVRHVRRVAAALQEVDHESGVDHIPSLTRTDPLPMEKRCGRPFEDDFFLDRDFLFVPTIYEIEESEGPDVSTLFVKRDIFMGFLGNSYAKRSTHDAEPDGDVGSATRASAVHDVLDMPAWSLECKEARLRELTEALDEERRQSHGLRRLSDEMQDRASSLANEAEERNRTLRTLQTQNFELTQRCDDLENRAVSLGARIQDREQLFQSKHDHLRRTNVELEIKLTETMDQAEARGAAHRSEKMALEKQLKECQCLNEQLNEELDSGKILRREGHDETRKLREQVESLQNLLTESEESANTKALRLQEKESEVGRLRTEINEQQLANGHLRECETRLMERERDLRRRLEDSVERANRLEIEVGELGHTTETLEEEKSELSSTCEKLQKDLEDSARRATQPEEVERPPEQAVGGSPGHTGPRSAVQATMAGPDRQSQHPRHQTVNARKRKGLAQDSARGDVQGDGGQLASTGTARVHEVYSQDGNKKAPVSGTGAATAVKGPEGEGAKLSWRDTFSEDEFTRRRFKLHHIALDDPETRDEPSLP